jgi:alpha-amylase
VSEPLDFLFGVHNHQPVGNFDGVIAEAVAAAYHPFLAAVAAAGVPVTVHCSGGLLAWMRTRAGATFDLLGRLAASGQVELLGGGFYEPILPMLPDADKVGQIEALADYLQRHFGVRPRGAWLAERVWEPHLPAVLRRAGVEFVVVDDHHFDLAGLPAATVGGYYLTDEQGASLAVFPISQRLRYLVPFAPPEASRAYLAERREAGAVTLVDDGEKFGVWPGTARLVYEEGWLRRWLGLLAETDWLRLSTFSAHLARRPPRGRAYLPTASYREMGDWALPVAETEALEAARHRLEGEPDGARLVARLRGGLWRSFLVKYPEVGDTYWRMLALSRRVAVALAEAPTEPLLLEARERLWQGQANDAYWHGVFGGCYLPHLRRAVRSALVAAEARLARAGRALPEGWQAGDLNGDGRPELRACTAELAVTLAPGEGGGLTELSVFPLEMDLADVIARRPEAYHRQLRDGGPPAGDDGGGVRTIHDRLEAKEEGLARWLGYDPGRRASLIEGVFPAAGEVDPLEPWAAARVWLAATVMAQETGLADGRAWARLSADASPLPLRVVKEVTLPRAGARLELRYRLAWQGGEPLAGRWGVQLNLALTAGAAPGRYYRVAGRPDLASRGRIADSHGLALVDEWVGAEIVLAWPEPAEVAWAPVETVSLSEAGAERIYQGSALLLLWPLALAAGGQREIELRLGVRLLGRGPNSP